MVLVFQVLNLSARGRDLELSPTRLPFPGLIGLRRLLLTQVIRQFGSGPCQFLTHLQFQLPSEEHFFVERFHWSCPGEFILGFFRRLAPSLGRAENSLRFLSQFLICLPIERSTQGDGAFCDVLRQRLSAL